MQPITETNTTLAADTHDVFIIENSPKGGPRTPTRILISHGLGDKRRGWIPTTIAHHFSRHGFLTARFGYYGSELTARKLHECNSIQDHIADLSAVSNRNKADFERTILIGHSWGGLIAAMSDLPDLDGLILVDPTFTPGWTKDTTKISEQFRILNWGSSSLVTEAYCQEAEGFAQNSDIMIAAAQKIKAPVLTILAGEGQKPGRNRDGWHNHLPAGHLKELISVPGADHEFTTPGTAPKMLDTAQDWIQSLP